MSGNGKGGNNRRRPPFKRRDRNGGDRVEPPQNADPRFTDPRNVGSHLVGPQGVGKNRNEKPRFDKDRGVFFDRPKWTPVKPPAAPLPSPDCPVCGKPIKDITQALTDRNTGTPVHFDCILGRVTENEPLEQGDTVAYIGGGRFAVVNYPNGSGRQEARNFRIKKILELEDKEHRAEWRKDIADHFSVT